MNRRKRFAFRNRKGFALILVFSLASMVLLLALSLVSLTQVESASSQYDQGLRVARANARLALQMALGDLQEFAGPDQRITATADGKRQEGAVPSVASFNDSGEPDPTGNGMVYEPFWTGVWKSDGTTTNPVWLVTRPLSADYTLENGTQMADPFSPVNGSVPIVGRSSAEPDSPTDQPFYNVTVPKEKINSSNIVGFEDENAEATIGHYAYWVGDNGVKASYLIEDHVSEVTHDNYANDDERMRLGSMMGHRSHFEVENTLVNVGNARLKSIANEFALRDSGEGTSLLGTGAGFYTKNDVRKRFHDFAGLSRGLLVDTVRGGLREDLSVIHEVETGGGIGTDTVEEILVNQHLMPYLNVGALGSTALSGLTRSYVIKAGNSDIELGDPEPTIAPLVAGIKLAVRVRAPDLGTGSDPVLSSSALKGQLEMSVKLWNPYTSVIEGNGTDTKITLQLVNLNSDAGANGITVVYSILNATIGELSTQQTKTGIGFWKLMNADESDVIEFVINVADEEWAPGETRMFVGVLDPPEPSASSGPLQVDLLSTTDPTIDDVPVQFYPIVELGSYDSSASSAGGVPGDINDRIHFIIPTWTPEFDLKIGNSVVAEYRLIDVDYASPLRSSHLPAKGNVGPNIAYIWELGNPSVDWVDYDPRSGTLSSNVLNSLFSSNFQDPGNSLALGHEFQSSTTELWGFSSGDVTHNIPLFELPRQEFVSLGALHMAEFSSGLRSHLGSAGTTGSINDIFDRFFLSTVPQFDVPDSPNWAFEDPLPNGRMEVVGLASKAELQDKDSAEHLYVKGAFNLNSTSVEAWASVLKGIRLGLWQYDDGVGGTGEVDLTGSNQFLRFSQSAEETWQGTYGTDSIDLTRERFRKGISSYTDAEVGLLAVEIVKGIRTRRQSPIAPMGPFVSLQDFIDSGVIETAISGASLNSENDEIYSSSYLTQQDVLTAIAPFLSVRSDTFVVRAYGDAVNPFDDEEILARAYCEAIVQRTHTIHELDSNSGNDMAPAGLLAGELGREFKVIAFRWMTGDQL